MKCNTLAFHLRCACLYFTCWLKFLWTADQAVLTLKTWFACKCFRKSTEWNWKFWMVRFSSVIWNRKSNWLLVFCTPPVAVSCLIVNCFCCLYYVCVTLSASLLANCKFVNLLTCRKNVPDYSASRAMNDLGFVSFDLSAGIDTVVLLNCSC